MVVTVAILTSALVVPEAPTPRAYAQFDHCVSGPGGMVCITYPPASHGAQSQIIQDCRSFSGGKCSGSQTGFGEFGNVIKKPK